MNPGLRVLHLITAMEGGGAETFLSRLALAQRADVEPLVASLLPPGPVGRELAACGVRVEHLGLSRGRPSPAAGARGLSRLRALVRSFSPHVVQTWLYHADLLGLSALRLPPAPLRPRPALAWNVRCAYMDFSRYPALTRYTVRACALLSRLPDAVVTNAHAARDHHLALGYRPRRFEVLPNGFDTDAFRPDAEARARVRAELGLDGSTPLVGAAGRWDAMKDWPALAAAARAVLAEHPRARFLLCGTGMDVANPDLAALLEAQGIRGACLLLGRRDDMPRVLAALDVFAQSSLGEGLPNALGEALCCGVPAAATDAGDSALLVGGGRERAGIVTPVGDAEALARAVAELLALDPQGRAALGAAGRERMQQSYGLDAAGARYTALYRELAARP